MFFISTKLKSWLLPIVYYAVLLFQVFNLDSRYSALSVEIQDSIPTDGESVVKTCSSLDDLECVRLNDLGSASSGSSIKPLTTWVQENGGLIGDLEIRFDSGYGLRGGFAIRDIEAGTNIIDVPLKFLITTEMGKKTEVSTKYIVDFVIN